MRDDGATSIDKLAGLRKTSTCKLNRGNWVPKPHARVHGSNKCPSTDQERQRHEDASSVVNADLIQHSLLVAQAKHDEQLLQHALALAQTRKVDHSVDLRAKD